MLQARSEILCNLPLSPTDSWTSVLLTGNLAMFDQSAALESRPLDPHRELGYTVLHVWLAVGESHNVVIDDTSEAQERLQKMHPKFMDDGLTKAYALYWASATRLQVPVFGDFHGIFSTRLAFLVMKLMKAIQFKF